jgi:hypothetical protein
MDNIIQIMARADVEWQGPGTRVEELDKPIADGVRDRIRAIISALERRVQHFGGRARRLDVSLIAGAG